jgi:hypothetical protein
MGYGRRRFLFQQREIRLCSGAFWIVSECPLKMGAGNFQIPVQSGQCSQVVFDKRAGLGFLNSF